MMIANRYQLGEKIGQGGMGSVYRAIDTHTTRPVAIKVLTKDLDDEEYQESLLRFKREGEVLRRLEHPNIVDVLDTVEEDNRQYIVMEYVAGGSLAQVLKQVDRLPIERVVNIALELADALARAHHLDVIHRDIKPGNVLLTEKDEPRLTDFGIAHIAGSARMTEEGHVVGTVSYISPEILRAQPPSPRSDIWAFGVMLFEMLTKQRPFDRQHPMATMQAILTQRPPDITDMREDIPDALIDLIYRMLEKNVEQRIPSMRLVGAELEAIKYGYTLVLPQAEPVMADLGLPLRSKHQPTTTDMPEDTNFTLQTIATQSQTRVSRNLPKQATAFIGREQELADLSELLRRADVNLITILGPGGMGKTRLSIELADRVADEFRHGVFFVPLAPLNDAEQVITAISESLRLSFYERQSPRYQLLEYLRNKQMLLVLDNFEHILDGADILSDILQLATDVKIIVTSREKLNLRSETIYNIGGMSLHTSRLRTKTGSLRLDDLAAEPAVQLFVQSAQRARPDFALTEANKDNVARICELVDGMPLAIELAAAWVEMLSVEEIVQEISTDVNFLETDLRDMPDRHRSIRAVFDYSWQLMNEEEREIFMRLAVFRGPFSRDAAQSVAETSLKMLMTLANKSLLRRDVHGRFEVHAMLRQYAEGIMSEEARTTARERHAAYFAHMLEQETANLKGQRQREATITIEAQLQDIRAAWQYAIETRNFRWIDQSVEALNRFYDIMTLFEEGEAAFSRALEALRPVAQTEDEQLVIAKLLARLGWFTRRLRSPAQARAITEESLALLEELKHPAEMAFPLVTLGSIARDERNLPASVDYSARSLEHYRQLNDQWGIGFALYQLADALRVMGDYARSRQAFIESREVCQTIQDLNGVAWANLGLGRIAIAEGDYDAAREAFKRAYDTARQMGVSSWVLIETLQRLGWLAWRYLENYPDALKFYEAAHKIVLDFGTSRQLADSLMNLGMTHAALNNFIEGANYLSEGIALAEAIGAEAVLYKALVALAYPLALSRAANAELQELVVKWLGLVSSQAPAELADLAKLLLSELRSTLTAVVYDEALVQGENLPLNLAIEEAQALLNEARQA